MTDEKKANKVVSKKVPARAAGGLARSKAVPEERRSEIARKAAAARWGSKTPEAIRRGNFQQEFGIDVECYVLDDENKTAVISQRGMALAIGLKSESGLAFPRFLQGRAIQSNLGAELLDKIANPLIFNGSPPGSNAPPSLVKGYDVTILIDVCKVIVQAESNGLLVASQAHIARQAHIILSASAKAGIKGLVYALSGYDATREEIISAFKLYVQQEAKEYEKEFPPQLYEEWYKLYQLPKYPRGRPWAFKALTLDHIYHPLARSNGKLLGLLQESRVQSGDRTKKLHQFLAEVGVKALRQHLGQLLGIAQVSGSREEYESHVSRIFGVQRRLDLEGTSGN